MRRCVAPCTALFASSVFAQQSAPVIRFDSIPDPVNMVIKFNPEGRVVMVFGRKQEASDEETGPLKHPKRPLPAEDVREARVRYACTEALRAAFRNL